MRRKRVDFKKLKAEGWEKFEKEFERLETEVGAEDLESFKSLCKSAYYDIFPTTQKDAKKLVSEFPKYLDSVLNLYEKSSEDLYPNCKTFIDKLCDDLFNLTKGEGIGDSLWNHWNVTCYLQKVVEEYGILNQDKEIGKNISVFILSQLYVYLFELTLKFLTEFAIVIATKKQTHDRHSEKFLEHYSKTDGFVYRNQLLEFFRRQRYFPQGKCKMLYDTEFRDKPAHASFYFNEDTGELFIDNASVGIEELEKKFKELLSLYFYLMGSYMKRSKLFKQTKIICKQLKKQLSK